MSELLPEIERRRAHRALSEEAVPAETVERLVTAATYAPSCANNQPWRLLVVDQEESLGRVKQHLSGGNYWAQKSPLIFCMVTRPDLDCRTPDGREYALFDTGLAAMNLMLQAAREGLIAHPIAGFKPAPVKVELGIPEDYLLVTLIICGRPGDEGHLSEKHLASEHGERVRKPRAEVVSRNRFQASDPAED
jgi:nitroreductase